MKAVRIALVGDYSEQVVAHRAIPLALERAALGQAVSWEWVPSGSAAQPGHLDAFDALWLVPGSPYASMDGALEAVRWAREGRRPFLGTCGGFQHAAIEIARRVAGFADADHAESRPGASRLVVTRLSCSLAGVSGTVRFDPQSRLREAYGRPDAVEGYQCNYGVDGAWRSVLEAAGLSFTAWDEAGEIRGAELRGHPFFVGVLFQPERAALRGETPPLVRAFVAAAS